LDEQDKYGNTALTFAIGNNHRGSAERLLDAGAKMSNVKKSVKIPDWVESIITKRKNAIRSIGVFIGVMRKRFEIQGQHMGNRLPRDVVGLLGNYLWETRFDEKWITMPSSIVSKKLKSSSTSSSSCNHKCKDKNACAHKCCKKQ
jgi:ankyrin repeat protein